MQVCTLFELAKTFIQASHSKLQEDGKKFHDKKKEEKLSKREEVALLISL